jgi:hypothetical protein
MTTDSALQPFVTNLFTRLPWWRLLSHFRSPAESVMLPFDYQLVREVDGLLLQ